MRKNTKPLIETHLELCKMWHPTKNTLTTSEVHKNSKIKTWWKCPVADDHEWESYVFSQVKYPGCPYCSGQRVSASNCLAAKYPMIAKQWHVQLNAYTPKEVTSSSAKFAWWQCDKNEKHVWSARIFSRTKNNSGCPFCANKIAHHTNNLAELYPEISKEWHPELNGAMLAEHFVPGSSKIVWWKCSKNTNHEWKSSIKHRTQDGTGCPYCSGQAVDVGNSLATCYPEIAREWHTIKNGSLTPQMVVPRSHKIVWWKCDKGDDHEWEASIANRINRESGCPCCCGRKAVKSNCVATTHPQVAKEWHLTKNENVTPNDITYACNSSYWFQCSIDPTHEWRSRIDARCRIQGTGCPICASSKGEKLIRDILESKNISYEQQYKFPDCKNKRCLPFDFALFNKDKKVIGVIEFNGRQHYNPIDYFGGKLGHLLTRINDQIKHNYCEQHQISFLCVPFWNIATTEVLLKDFLERLIF